MITYASMGQPGNRLTIHDLGTSSIRAIWLDHFELGMPIVREDTSDRPRSHGIDDFTELYGARAINMTGVLFSHDLEHQATILDNLKAHFSLFGSAQKELTIQRLGRAYREFLYVRVADFTAPIDAPGNMVEWGATLVAADPRIYRRMDPDPKLAKFKSSHTIHNTGTGISTPPVVRIYGPADAGSGVKNASLSVERSFRLSRHIKRGSHVEIDCGTRQVTLNGKRAQGLLEPGAWFWKLHPGKNHLQRIGRMDGHIEVDWREARL